MKQSVFSQMVFCMFFSVAVAEEPPSWNLTGNTIWTREPNTATMSKENGTHIIAHPQIPLPFDDLNK